MWEKEIYSNLNTADIILLLISKDFVSSEYCISVEMKRALERHENGTARVIPIMLRHVDHEGAIFSHLQALPAGAVPVTDRKWRNLDEAFRDVAKGIRKVVKELFCEQCLYEGNIHFYRQQYNEALAAFEQAICHNPTNALAYIGKGQALNQLAPAPNDDPFEENSYYKNALTAFEQAISLDATNALAHEGRAIALYGSAWWSEQGEILKAYEQAIHLAPKNESVYIAQGYAYVNFQRFSDALIAYEKAIEVAPFPNRDAYKGKLEALIKLERYEEALATCEKSIQEFPESGRLYSIKGEILYNLKRYKEALIAYEQAIRFSYKSAHLYNLLGDVFYQLSDYKKALDAYEQAIFLYPHYAEALKGKANVLKLLAEEALKDAGSYPF